MATLTQITPITFDKHVDLLARIGYAARAAVYALMGTFALLLSLGFKKGELTDSKGSLRQLIEQPFGKIFLAVLGFGLIAYAVWRLLQAVLDYEQKGTSAKGLLLRSGYLFGGIVHALLGYSAINLIFHLSRESNGSRDKDVAFWLLTQPFGQFLAGAVALGIFAFGIGQIMIAVKEKFMKHLHLPADKKMWLSRICKFGLICRGIVFCIVGWLFLRAAFYANSSEAKGVKGAWQFIADQPFGEALVGVTALGLIAFAAYGLTEALYRRTT